MLHPHADHPAKLYRLGHETVLSRSNNTNAYVRTKRHMDEVSRYPLGPCLRKPISRVLENVQSIGIVSFLLPVGRSRRDREKAPTVRKVSRSIVAEAELRRAKRLARPESWHPPNILSR